ncbi:replication restart helicase PriA [Candidatus Nitrospira allomarina]|uniref:Probable replication restart protein PriA n=1 Tax=Candidatus Nitrospira allomarina TaxID=3020900 RepID=A0AA96GCV5_9BACT|nr:primosomal protein N' [Candidatus Nitrospira allomarina]WNM59256.1 primosomal protein N' [Candidatus Nitrospira allomarina]
MLADVVLPARRFQVFTYQVPLHLLSLLQVGSPVMVPLGSTVVSGVVVSLFETQNSSSLQTQFRQKPLRAILSLEADAGNRPLEHNLLRLVEKISDYYLAPFSACLRLIVPPHSIPVIRRISLTDDGRQALSDRSLASDVQLVLRKLEQAPRGLLRSSLMRTMNNGSDILARAKRKGWIIEQTTLPSGSKGQSPVRGSRVGRNPMHSASRGLFDSPEESREIPESLQRSASGFKDNRTWNLLFTAVQTGGFQEVPVVGLESIRQDLLFTMIETILNKGRRVLILAPEVQQAEILGEQVRLVGNIQVEVYHGHLSTMVRAARWERIRQGDVQVVVGTRSALFLPVPNLGLVWINQEEDPSYKDEHLPYFHAREVARMRGECDQALVVYSSTSPSLELYGRFTEQVGEALERSSQQIPHVNMVDLRTFSYETIMSPVLITRITQSLDEGKQVILLLNRKGFSGALVCRDCGKAPSCPTCGVALKLYQRPSRLVCTYCEGIQPTPETCPTCQGRVFRFSGMGTQRLEEEVRRLFPAVPVARFDRENVKTPEAADTMLRQFRQRDIGVMIGTEFLVHQSEPPTAPVIGLPQADLGLHIPEFRSAERTFQMLSRALRLARNGQEPGEVILQTRIPDHHVLTAIGHQWPRMFYDQELELRDLLGYPPTTHVILLVVTGEQATRVQKIVGFLQQRLKEFEGRRPSGAAGKGGMGTPMVLGPMASKKPGRIKKNRVIFLIKTVDLSEAQRGLRSLQRAYEAEFPKDPVIVEFNVDPMDIQ